MKRTIYKNLDKYFIKGKCGTGTLFDTCEFTEVKKFLFFYIHTNNKFFFNYCDFRKVGKAYVL